MFSPKPFTWPLAAVVALTLLAATRATIGCPYCDPGRATLAQNIESNDVAAIIELVELPPDDGNGERFAPGLGDKLPKAKFRVLQILKGAEHVKNLKTIETVYFGDSPVGTRFFVTGIDPKALVWTMPQNLSKTGEQYIAELPKLPKTGSERLAFFMNYLEDKDEVLRQDAYDEFAGASYDDLKGLGPKMSREKLISRIKDPEIVTSRRRLYLTMLGVCGKIDDLPFLESLITSKDRRQREGLDALIGCYLSIKGPTGLKLVEDRFLTDTSENFPETNSTLQALRIAEDSGILKKEEAATSFRRLLDNPTLADLVVADLTRWEDWTAIDRLAELFVKADPEKNWVRVPVLKYMQFCPLPEAKKQLARLEKIDPVAAKQAAAFSELSGLLTGSNKAPAGKPANDKSSKSEPGKATAGKPDGLKSGNGS